MKLLALAALCGCCVLLLLPALPPPAALATIAALGLALVLRLHQGALAALALAFAAAGVTGQFALAARLAPSQEGVTLSLQGAVVSIPERSAGSALRFVVELEDDPRPGLPRRVELTWHEPLFTPRTGERLAFEVRLRAPRGFANPGGRDREAQLLRERIGATGYVRSAERVPEAAARRLWRAPVLALRAAIATRIESILGTRPATGIAQGLAVGLQDAVSAEQWLALSRSGTSHLMAISGLHIGMFAALGAGLGMLFGRLQLRCGASGAARDTAIVAAVLCTLAYAALAGWSVPTQRTALMICIGALALRLRRASGAADVLALSVLAVLALDVLAPLAIGFWLSFGAVAAILVSVGGARAGALGAFARTQLAVTLGLAPVLALAVGGVSLVSFGVNALAVPLYTLVVVPLLLLGVACAFVVEPLGVVLLQATAWLIEASWPLIAVPAGWHLAIWPIAALPPWAAVLLALGAVATLLPLALHARCAGAVLVVACCLARPAPLPPQTARVTVLDVGQGLSVLVETRAHAVLYDTGPAFRSGGDAGAIAIVPHLRHRGVHRLQRVVVSHEDLDHSGGLRSVLDALYVDEVVSSRAVPGIESSRCRAGEGWDWDGIRFRWLHPGAVLPAGDNDASCVLQVEAGSTRVVLTGDVEAEGEAQLLARATLSPVAMLTAPHHGSRTSSSPAFVQATRPQWVVYPVGHRNRWGFPKAEVRARWRDAGAHELDTAASGAIVFVMDSQGLSAPIEHRRQRRRWWQALSAPGPAAPRATSA